MIDIEPSVTYLMEDDDWLRTVAIGGALSVLGFLIVPVFIVYGYVVETIRHGLADDPDPPEFEDWGELLVYGLKAGVIGFVYMLVPIAVAAVTVGSAFLAFATGTDASVSAGLAGLLGGLALSAILSLVFGYFGVVGIVNFANEGRVGAGFDVSRITSVALEADYAVAFLLSVGVFIVAGAIGSVLSTIPLLGWIISAFLLFYAQVVAGHMWGRGFAAATELEPETPVEDTDVAV